MAGINTAEYIVPMLEVAEAEVDADEGAEAETAVLLIFPDSSEDQVDIMKMLAIDWYLQGEEAGRVNHAEGREVDALDVEAKAYFDKGIEMTVLSLFPDAEDRQIEAVRSFASSWFLRGEEMGQILDSEDATDDTTQAKLQLGLIGPFVMLETEQYAETLTEEYKAVEFEIGNDAEYHTAFGFCRVHEARRRYQ